MADHAAVSQATATTAGSHPSGSGRLLQPARRCGLHPSLPSGFGRIGPPPSLAGPSSWPPPLLPLPDPAGEVIHPPQAARVAAGGPPPCPAVLTDTTDHAREGSGGHAAVASRPAAGIPLRPAARASNNSAGHARGGSGLMEDEGQRTRLLFLGVRLQNKIVSGCN